MKFCELWEKWFVILLITLALISCKRTESNSQSADATEILTPSNRPAILSTITAAGTEYSTEAEKLASKSSVYFVDKVEFSENGLGVATTLLLGKDQWQVLFNDQPGSIYPAVGPVSVSPNGRHYAYKARVGSLWCLVLDGSQTSSCYDDITAASYSADSKHLIVEYTQQGRYFLWVDNHISSGSSSLYRTPTFIDDYKKLVFIDSIENKDAGRLVISSADLRSMRSIADNITDFVISSDKRQLAAIQLTASGKARMLRFDLQNLSDSTKGIEFDKISFEAFSQSGDDLFYFGSRGKEFIGVFNGKEEQLPVGYEPVRVAINRSDKSVGVLVGKEKSVFLYRMFRASGRQSQDQFDDAESLTFGTDGSKAAFVARNGNSQFIVVNNRKGPDFDRVVAPMFSPDGKYLVYRARKAGRRFVVIADSSGNTIRQHPAYDHVHDVKFVDGGKAIAYGVKDGRSLAWKVEPL